MSKPFISICIPTYKRPELLKKLLDSINIQTFKNYEIIINDNSPDDSVEKLVRSYQDILSLSYKKNQPSVSAVENCIKIIQRANAEWVKIMHDDDWFASEDALQVFADAAEGSAKGFIFCASNQVWLDSGKQEEDVLTPKEKQMLD